MSVYPDADASGLIIESLRKPIRAYLLRLGASQDDADDLTQDVLISVWRRIDKIKPEALLAYAEKTARNAYIDHQASAISRYETIETDVGCCTDDLVSDPLALEAFGVIYRDDELRRYASALLVALRSLCPAQRDAILHRYILGRTTRETADLLGISATHVKRNVSLGKRHLRTNHPHLADLLDGRDSEITTSST